MLNPPSQLALLIPSATARDEAASVARVFPRDVAFYDGSTCGALTFGKRELVYTCNSRTGLSLSSRSESRTSIGAASTANPAGGSRRDRKHIRRDFPRGLGALVTKSFRSRASFVVRKFAIVHSDYTADLAGHDDSEQEQVARAGSNLFAEISKIKSLARAICVLARNHVNAGMGICLRLTGRC